MGRMKSVTAGRVLSCLVIAVLAVATATLLARDPKKEDKAASITGWQHLAMTHALKGGMAGDELARRIVKLGRDGWELVSVEGISEAGTTTKTVYYFKRPL